MDSNWCCILSEVKHFHLATADLVWHAEASIEAWGACYFPSRHLIRVHVTFYNWTDHWSWTFWIQISISLTFLQNKRTFCPVLRKCFPTWVLVEACTDQLCRISRQVSVGKLHSRIMMHKVSFHKKEPDSVQSVSFFFLCNKLKSISNSSASAAVSCPCPW